MSADKFKKGDRGICTMSQDYEPIKKGMYGTFVCENKLCKSYGFIWDKVNMGHPYTHDLDGALDKPIGRYINRNFVKKLNKPVKRKRNVLMQHVQALFIKIKDHYKCCHSRMDGIVRYIDNKVGRNKKAILELKEKNKIQLRINEMFNDEIDAIKKDLHEINPFVDTAKERYEQLKKDNDGDYENLYQKCERVMKNEPVNEQGYTMEEIKRHWNNGTYIKFNNNIYRKSRNKLYFHFPVDNYKLVFVNEFGKKGGQNECRSN